MISLFATSVAPPLSEIVSIVVAGLGGIGVFIGLLLERIAEKKKERFEPPFINPSRRLGNVGWYILMAGIFVEIGVAAWTAWGDWQTRQMAIKNNPLNQLVSEISASATVNVEGTNFDGVPQPGPHPDTWLELVEKNINNRTLILGEFQSLEAQDVQMFNHWEFFKTNNPVGYGYIIQFRLNRINQEAYVNFNIKRPTVREVLDKIHVLLIHVQMIPKDREITGGSVEMVINGTFRKQFRIAKQRTDKRESELNPNDSGFYLYATNVVPEN